MAHRVEFRPLFADADPMNVVYYGRYLRFFELGRTELLRAGGRSYAELEAAGLHLPATEVYARYRRPARYDELLVVETAVGWVRRASLRFDYRILRGVSGGGEELLVEGYTVHGCVDREGKVVALPVWVVNIAESHVRSGSLAGGGR